VTSEKSPNAEASAPGETVASKLAAFNTAIFSGTMRSIGEVTTDAITGSKRAK